MFQFKGMKLGQLHAKLALAMILKDVDVYQKSDVQNVLDSWSTINTSNGLKLELKEL